MNTQLAELQQFLEQEFDLPKVEVPAYTVGEFDGWKVSVNNPRINLIRGYFNGLQHMQTKNYVLTHEDGTVWMSLTPLELESHSYHIEWAKGEVVVGGLGMGMYLYNIIKKPEVTQVWVVEQEAAIIQAFMKFANPESWDGWEKVNIINADIKALNDEDIEQLRNADYLYVDIWPLVGDENSLPDMTKISADLTPKAAGWWTQEYDYIHAIMEMRDEGADNLQGNVAMAELYLKNLGITALGSTVPNYEELVRAAAMNMMNA